MQISKEELYNLIDYYQSKVRDLEKRKQECLKYQALLYAQVERMNSTPIPFIPVIENVDKATGEILTD